MCAVAPAARPFCGGVPRRSAPVRSNKPRGAAPSACAAKMARDSSACRAGAGGFYVTRKETINGAEVEVEVIPVGGEKSVDPAPGHLRGVLPRERLAAVEALAVPRRKRTKLTRNYIEDEAEVLTVGGEMPVDPALDLLRKRMVTELEALREILKKAELISRGPAHKSKRLLGAEPRTEPRMEAKTPSVKRRKVSPMPEQKQIKVPRMSPDERDKLAGRLTSLAELPGHIAEFLQQQFGENADPNGEIEIDVHKVEDSVLFELKTQLDKFAEERLLPKEQEDSVVMELDTTTQMDNNLAEAIKGDVVPGQKEEDVDICGGDVVPEQEEEVDICGMSDSESDSSSSSDSDGSSSGSDSDGSSSGSDSDSESDSDEDVDSPAPPAVLPEEHGTSAQPPPDPAPEAVRSTKPESVPSGVSTAQPPLHPASEVAPIAEPKKAQGVQRAAPKAVCIPGMIYRAKVRRELLEMERAALPDESIHTRDLRRLCIAEYGRPSVMRQLGLSLKADA